MHGRREQGMVVLLSLVLLVIVLLLGSAAAGLGVQGELAARAARDREVAFQAAEAAVADAEHDIGNGTAVVTPCSETTAWQSVDLSGQEDGGACTLALGAHTKANFDSATATLSFKRPRYLIERLACHQPGDDGAADAAAHYCYRVTAIGFGPQPATEVVLQTIFTTGD